jgi:hypothetical protein
MWILQLREAPMSDHIPSKERPLIDALVLIQAGGLSARTLNDIAKRALEDYAMQNPNQAGPASCEGDGFKAPAAGGGLPNRSAIEPTLYVKHPDGTYSEYKPPTPETPAVLRVKLAKDIYDDGQDHHPPGYIGRKGETVVIHSIQTAVVSHSGTGHGFVVHDGELELTETPAVNGAGQ